jgi:hypothetical protein
LAKKTEKKQACVWQAALILFVPPFSGTFAPAPAGLLISSGFFKTKNLRPNEKALLPLAFSKEDATAA